VSAQERIEEAMGGLGGLVLSGSRRDLNELTLTFSEASGRQEKLYELIINCAWRLFSADGILVGSGNLFTPLDPSDDPAYFNIELPDASWWDLRWREFLEHSPATSLVVNEVAASPLGDVRVSLSGGLILQIFPCAAATDHFAVDHWRLRRIGSSEDDFIATTYGIGYEDTDESSE
jgi:hypothetical protein